MFILRLGLCITIAEHNQTFKFSIISRVMKKKNDKISILNFKDQNFNPFSSKTFNRFTQSITKREDLVTHIHLRTNFKILEIELQI